MFSRLLLLCGCRLCLRVFLVSGCRISGGSRVGKVLGDVLMVRVSLLFSCCCLMVR